MSTTVSTEGKQLIGKAPLTIVRTTAGTASYVYRGKPAPTNITKEELNRLIGGGFLQWVDAVVDEVSEPSTPTPGSAPAILAEVGTDKAKAQVALDEELAGKNRTTLVASLQKIIGA